ncbi:sugar O-acetyltransferase, partial [Gordonibacter urolithinfaciens]
PGTAGGSTRSPASPPAQGAGLPGSPVPSRKAAARAASASAGGAWFDSADPALMRDHIRACEVMARFNAQQGMLDADRMKMLHGFLGAVGEGSSLSTGAQVDYGYNLFLGRNCFFNFNCTFLDGAPITFGDDVGVGPGCSFVTPLHPLLARERARCEDAGGTGHVWERSLPITVESGVWIAANVTVNAGVTIGEGAVIGSGSVVTRDIPPRTLAYGNPCRPVRAITEADSVADALAEAGLV